MIKRLTRAVGAVLLGMAMAVTLAPAAVQADEVRPAYYLYNIRTGEMGPCANRVGTYEGKFAVPRWHYSTSLGKVYRHSTVYVRRYSVGQYKYTEYKQKGFTSAYRYKGCYGNYPARGYYGAHKVSRIKTLVQFCRDSCNGGSWSYKPWKHGW
jgi:hypothetical protein